MSIKKKAGCALGLMFGSFLKLLTAILNITVHFLAAVFSFFGLWLPFIYALIGFILYFAFKFNPFEGGTEGQLFIAGFAASCICALVITIRNLIIKPIKSTLTGYANPIWEDANKKLEEYRRPNVRIRQPEKRVYADRREEECGKREPSRPREYGKRIAAGEYEKPEIYYSKLEEGLLVHEFSDRFELYRIVGDRAKLERVEYK